MVITKNQLFNNYINYIKNKEVNIEKCIEMIVQDYKTVRITDIDYSETGNDILLFQYGHYKFTNNGFFTIDITRQIIEKDKFEPIQISVEFVYDSSPFINTESCEFWSDSFESIDSFILKIQSTPGYKTAKCISPNKTEVLLEQC